MNRAVATGSRLLFGGRNAQLRTGNGGVPSPVVLLIAFIATLPLCVALLSFLSGSGDAWAHLARYVLPEALVNTVVLAAGVLAPLGVAPAAARIRSTFASRPSLTL